MVSELNGAFAFASHWKVDDVVHLALAAGCGRRSVVRASELCIL